MLEVNLSSFFGSSNKGLFKSVRILEKLESGFWKVQTSSGIIKVFSDEKLETGKTVRGFLVRSGNIVKLEILNQENSRVSPDFFYSDSLRQTDILLKTAAKLNIQITEREIYLIKKILRKKGSAKYILPFLLDAADKGFSSDGPLSSLSGSLDSRQEKGGSRRKLKKYFKKKVEEAESSESPLFLYNHLKNRKDSWSLFPFNLEGAVKAEGAVCFRISDKKILNIMVNAVCSSGSEWVFFITPVKSSYRMKIFCSEAEKAGESESFIKFRKKLQNLRVEIDDNIRDIVYFSAYDEENDIDLDVTV